MSLFSVNTNLGAMAALQSLTNTESSLKATQNAISTGQKVSQASDNPAIYTISQTMNDQISGLTAVSDNLNFAQSVITTAQSAATNISSQLASLLNTVTTGLQSGINTTTVNNQINSILSNINAFANGATFNGVNITSTAGTGQTTSQLNVTTDLSGTTAIELGANGTTSTAQQFDMTTNGTHGLGLSGLSVTAQTSFSFASSSGNVYTPTNGDSFSVTVGGVQNTFYLTDTNANSAPTVATATSATQQNYFVTYNSQTDSLATVINDLATGMQKQGLAATVDNSGNLDVVGATAGAFAAATGNTSTAPTATTTTAGQSATAAVATVNTAISTLNLKIASLGQFQQQITGLQGFTTALSTSLTAGVGALTDADMAAESAKLTSLQTKQQLGIQSLSIANQQPQALLKLFGG